MLLVSGPDARRVPAGAADQRRRGAGGRRGLVRGAARPQGPHAGRHAGAAAGAPRRSWLDTEPRRCAAAAQAPRRCTRSAATSRSPTRARSGRSLSLIGPRSAEIAGAPPLPEYAYEATQRRRDRVPRGRHRATGIDLIAAAADARAAARRAAEAGAVEVSAGGGRDPPDRGRRAALRRRDGHRDDARRGRHRRARGQLHEGLLHRPGDGRPPPLQGQAEPPPARAAAERRRPSPGRRCWLGEKEVGTLGGAAVSPALGPIGLAIVRREAEPGDRARRR